MKAVFAAALVASVPWAAFAQGLDYVEQRVLVDVSGAELRVEITVHALALSELREIHLPAFLMPGTVEIDGLPGTLEPHRMYPQYVTVAEPQAAIAAGSAFEMHLVLSGFPACDPPGSRYAQCLRSAAETVLPPGQPGSAWYVLNLYALDPFTGEVRVRAQADQHVVAGAGAATSIVDETGGTRLWTFDVPAPTEMLAVYAGRAELVEATGAPSVVALFEDNGRNREKVAHGVELAAQVIDAHARAFGPLPVDVVHLVTVPPIFAFGGLGLLGNVLLIDPIFGDYDYLLEQGIAHELAHSWWGNLASSAVQEESPFFGESFAEYAGWRALGELGGPEVRMSGVRMNAVWYMFGRPNDADVAALAPDAYTSPVFIHAIYHKASTVLRTFEARAGRDAFDVALRNLIARGYGGLYVESLAAEIRAASGWDPTPDIDQWLRRPGFPKLRVSGAFIENRVLLSVTIDEPFDVRLPLRIIMSDGETIEHAIDLHRGTTELSIELNKKPAAIEVDPEWTAVRRISPELEGDVTLDGEVDGADLIAVALMNGGAMPTQRRIDGRYDPLFDIDADKVIDGRDLEAVRTAAR